MLTFNFSVYLVGTEATPRHFRRTLAELETIHTNSDYSICFPSYVVHWALLPHSPGDTLLAITTFPGEDRPHVIRYQVIAS